MRFDGLALVISTERDGARILETWRCPARDNTPSGASVSDHEL